MFGLEEELQGEVEKWKKIATKLYKELEGCYFVPGYFMDVKAVLDEYKELIKQQP